MPVTTSPRLTSVMEFSTTARRFDTTSLLVSWFTSRNLSFKVCSTQTTTTKSSQQRSANKILLLWNQLCVRARGLLTVPTMSSVGSTPHKCDPGRKPRRPMQFTMHPPRFTAKMVPSKTPSAVCACEKRARKGWGWDS
jgi:hypothetical protein